jgi:4'-phosphopantetheinyl transferase
MSGDNPTNQTPPTRGLPTNGVDIWLSFINEIHDPSLLGRYRNMMAADEQGRQDRYRLAADRHRDLVTRALVRTTLSMYLPAIAPAEWVFESNAYGRPRIMNPEAGPLDFNISHSGTAVAVAVGSSAQLGIDLEVIRDCPSAIELAGRFFDKGEAIALQQLAATSRSLRFLEIWTLKEAYIKARGMGLSVPLDECSFNLSTDRTIHFELNDALEAKGHDWRFFQWIVPNEVVFALSVAATEPGNITVNLNESLPLVGSKPFRCGELRRSTVRSLSC